MLAWARLVVQLMEWSDWTWHLFSSVKQTEFADIDSVRQEKERNQGCFIEGMMWLSRARVHLRGERSLVSVLSYILSVAFNCRFEKPPIQWLCHTLVFLMQQEIQKQGIPGMLQCVPILSRTQTPRIFLLSHPWHMTFLLIQNDFCTSRHQVHIPGRKRGRWGRGKCKKKHSSWVWLLLPRLLTQWLQLGQNESCAHQVARESREVIFSSDTLPSWTKSGFYWNWRRRVDIGRRL